MNYVIILQISCLFLIWKNALMYVYVKIYVASLSYLGVVDPDCRSIMKRKKENQVAQKYLSYKGDTANR
jgi:hypothetical protein